MLTHTFCHLNGITRAGEQKLWRDGIVCWDDLERGAGEVFGKRRRDTVRRSLEASRTALERGDAGFFLRDLRGAEASRLLPDFQAKIGYVDIETTGLSAWAQITTIALYGNGVARLYVRDRNLDDFVRDVRQFDVLVTYNGARFDLPFLRAAFGDVLPAGHIDLCPLLRGCGYRGGLKRCEQLLDVRRQVSEDLDGYWAVEAWYRHRAGDTGALPLLLKYNAQDTLSLEHLLTWAYNRSMEGHPKAPPFTVPVQPDLALVAADTLFFDNRISTTYCGA